MVGVCGSVGIRGYGGGGNEVNMRETTYYIRDGKKVKDISYFSMFFATVCLFSVLIGVAFHTWELASFGLLGLFGFYMYCEVA